MISCIIPVYKPDKGFEKLLRMLFTQKEQIGELILFNTFDEDFSDKDLAMLVRKTADSVYRSRALRRSELPKLDVSIHSVDRDCFDHGGTRAKAASLAKGDFLLFMTQDAVPEDRLLTENLLKAFDDNNVAVSYARQLPRKGASDKECYTRAFNYPDCDRVQNSESVGLYGIKTYFCSDVCAMYKKSIYDLLGGFVLKTIFNEDMIFARKAVDNGYTVKYQSSACVRHSHDYTYIQQFKRSFDLAVSQKQYVDYFSGTKSESEGVRYVLKGVLHFLGKKKPLTSIDFFIESGIRYVAFMLGRNYDRLPDELVRRLSSNPRYFNH